MSFYRKSPICPKCYKPYWNDFSSTAYPQLCKCTFEKRSITEMIKDIQKQLDDINKRLDNE